MKKYLLAGIMAILSGFGLLAQPSLVEVQTTDVSCNGGSDGTVFIRITGGVAPYSYSIIRGSEFHSSPLVADTFYTFTGVEAKSWHIFIEDANGQGFSEFDAAVVSEPAPISITGVNIIPITCAGFANAEIQVTAAGESGSYLFELNPDGITSTTGNFSPLAPGTYTVTVTDATGCSTSDVTDPLVIIDPDPVSVTSESATDVSCFGAGNGTVSATAAGGTPPYTYTLNPGALQTNGTGSFSGVAPGSYTVEVTDVNNCAPVTSNTVVVDEPGELIITGTNSTDITCNGGDDGIITVTVSGGTPGYEYTLTPGNVVNTTGVFSNLPQGDYTVSISDANSCGPVTTGTLSIGEPDPLSINDVIQEDVSCSGAGDGTISVTATGGTDPLSYTLNPGAITNLTGEFTTLNGGSYTVSVDDANSCPSVTTSSITITDPAPIAITGESKTDITCHGADDGNITVTATGGTGILTYTINPGALSNTTGSFTNLGPDTYTVSVRDENNCPEATTDPVTIIEPPALSIDSESATGISCTGFDDGTVSVAVSGGTPPYNYSLLPSGTTNSTGTFSGLPAGDYTIEITDASSCPVVSTGQLTVNEPEPITISGQSSQNISCNGAGDGWISIIATGGTAPLSYTLNPGAITNASGEFTSLEGDSYTITVDDANACPSASTEPIEIIDPAPVTITDLVKTDISCKGADDGTITISAAGGTGTLTYILSPGSVTNTTGSFNGLNAGSYTITVEDDKGCTTLTDPPVVILEPAEITASVDGSSMLSLSCSGDSNGNIDITVTGGTLPLVFEWTGPSGYTATSEDIGSLAAGTYTVNITDANSCMLITPLEVEITEPPVITLSLEKTDVTCAGDANGTITVTASGGTPSYEYSRNGITYQSSNVFTGLTQNNYTIYVRDANTCIISDNIEIDEPDELIVASEIRIDNNKCYGDSLGEIRILEVTGGVEPYLYSINDGVDFSSEPVFQNLPAGSYQTVVKDVNGCSSTGNLNKINQPGKIEIVDYDQVNITGCYGNVNGQIFIEVSGGTGSKSYSLNSGTPVSSGFFNPVAGGNHTITISDENLCTIDTSVFISEPDPILFSSLTITDVTGCPGDASGAVDFTATGGTGGLEYAINGGAFSGSGSFSGLLSGTHTLSVKDINDCQVDSIITITGLEPLSVQSETSTDISCVGANDGSISITASGGTQPYSYTLNPGGTIVNDGNFGGLPPGTYTVEIEDDNNCGPLTSTLLTINEPTPVNIDSVTTKEILCNGDDDAEIHIYLSGGTPPFEYSINDGATYSDQGGFAGLSPGSYLLAVRDANGCSLAVDTIEFTEPSALSVITESKTDINTCFGDTTGAIIYEVEGGSPPIEYSIDAGLNWQSDGTFSDLIAGDYTTIARDANGCQISSGIMSISQPGEISADIYTTLAIDENNKGSITISNATGGTGSLEYSISGSSGLFSTETVYTDLDAATYPVVIRDENGCSYEENVVVSEKVPLDVTFSISHSTCYGADDASIDLVANDPVGQPEYSIDDSASWTEDGLFENLLPGVYYVFARDEDDRYFQDTVIVNEPVQLIIFSNITPASCNSFSYDAAIDITVNGATGGVIYDWSNGATTEDLNNISAGKYRIMVIDENMCTATDTIEVPALTTVIADAGVDTSLCYGDHLILNGLGGTSLSWSPEEGLSDRDIANPVVETTEDRTYILTASGTNDCYDTDTINITVFPRLGLDAGNDTTVTESQSVTINTQGGPYLSYHWEPGLGIDDSTSANPTFSINQTTTYIVSAETEDGCIDRDTITISLADKLIVYNAFSPNGDDVNDYWDIDFANLYPDITVEVFNRWGERLFSSKGYSDEKRWNGKYKGTDVPVGTYYFVIVPYPGASAITGPVTVVR